MRKQLSPTFALAVLLGSSLTAQAADLPQPAYKAPPPPAPVFTWTGFYIGSHAGCGWFNTPNPNNFFTVGGTIAGFETVTEQASGCYAGAQIGANYQFSGNFVIGFEADGSWGKISSFNTTFDAITATAISWEDKLTTFGTVRGRLGWAINGGLPFFGGLGWMPYVTGGWAWARDKINVADTFTSDNQTLNGWTIGAGVEIALTPYLSWKAEYLYMEFDSKDFNVAFDNGLGVLPGASFDRLKVNVVQTGLNWRFGAGMGGY